MAIQEPTHLVESEVPEDVPDAREYERKENANLDQSLVDAIEAAEVAGNSFLARLLALELGSHYYETR